ncbi:cupin domain-containing protein [Streptococcus phocae subsp. salmonis]|uniref:cupin domain-containing protein n=1 Tax=Streptococcus phocae TaxID=119224 RepID=UPI000530DC56|nr:cupin domain-containing protein [Streptococcus phocae]KGR73228.1 cupin [Streptococcus phocae subsp. salmonis]
MLSKQEWISRLELEPHVEGGYFKQVEQSQDVGHYQGKERALYTSIYFLLDDTNPSHFHAGSPLTIHMIRDDGRYETHDLGLEISKGQSLHYCVPKGTIFGSTVASGYALVSCLVAPGFDYEDFKLFSRQELLATYPDHKEIIHKLTKD